MKVIKEGYVYGLHNVDNPQTQGQVVKFIEIENDGKLQTTKENGTSLFDFLEVALLKAKFDGKSREGSLVVTKIEEAILWLRRDAENKDKRLPEVGQVL